MHNNAPLSSQSTETPHTPTRAMLVIDAGAIMTKLTDLGYCLDYSDLATKVAFVAGGWMGDRLVAHDAINEAQPEEDWEKYMTNIQSIHEVALKDKGHRSDRKEPIHNAPSHLIVRHPLLIVETEADEMTDSSNEDEYLSKQDKGTRTVKAGNYIDPQYDPCSEDEANIIRRLAGLPGMTQ
ncbi:hypothetical protein JB92DRAFT_3119098 [Gautieria morchelliformis]|nr:hypothetical protein JB92DRAFT_3119098 [Gautieria morchelliformis]